MADPLHLRIPLDASEVPDFKPDQAVKVVVQDQTGTLRSRTVQLDDRGRGVAEFELDPPPKSLRVALGPENAPDEDVPGLQTLAFDVPARELAAGRDLKLQPVKITPFYWLWWRRWCRTFVINGRVLCPDGQPAPGAQVCAYDIDFFWWWSSYQKVGCATTGADGTFSIRFTWCCGFLPWWWWRQRYWRLEPDLAHHILPALRQGPGGLRGLPVPGPRPDLAIFERLLGDEGGRPFGPLQPGNQPVLQPGGGRFPGLDPGLRPPRILQPVRPPKGRFDPAVLGDLRERLVRRLPSVPALERLRLWPWFPWQPWFDCSPDIVFRVTQDCPEPGTVIIDEGPWQARWDLPNQSDVTLVADRACCLGDPVVPAGSCIVLSSVCGVPIEDIGGNYGNAGSSPAQLGYADPGGPGAYADRPFAETVSLAGQLGDAAADYYEIEFFDESIADWRPLPEGTVAGFSRRFHGPWVADASDPLSPFHWVAFPVREIDGHRVIESRLHFEQTHGPGTWGSTQDRRWTEINLDLLAYWITAGRFADDTYRLRVVGWDLNAAGDQLENRRVLPVCEEEPPIDNEVVVTLDNRFLDDPAHPASTLDHPCGTGTVHACTTEPDTDFLAVRILHADGTSTPVGACGNVPINDTDRLQIDFLVSDPEGHLATYTLGATYAENLVQWLVNTDCPGCPTGSDLLGSVPGATLVALTPGAQVGPEYGHAIASRSARSQGATSPLWHGGSYRLTLRARDVFPQTCCYQLELWASKRTIVSCSDRHTNQSHYTFMVVVPA